MDGTYWHKLLLNITMGVFLSVAASHLSAAEAPLMVRQEVVQTSDILGLPPICKLIMVENPNAHHNKDNIALFEKPGYEMGANNIHIHHYCWALISKQRYFRANGKIKRDFYFDLFMGDINYVLTNTKKDGTKWSYFHVLLIEQGEMLLIRGDYSGSLAKANEALKQKPDAEKAYILKYDTYMAMGDKNKAIEAAQEGLKINPISKQLRKRLANQGVVLPPLEITPVAPQQTQDQPDTATEESPTPQMEPDSMVNPSTNVAPYPREVQPGSNATPYCRFCP